jgi:alpha-galactosidase
MNPATISTTTFTLVLQGTTTPIGATVAYDNTSFTATLTPSAILQAGKVYTATIKGTSSGVKDASNNALAADKVWSFTTSSVATNTKFLSDLTWTSMTNGWGPAEKDMSNGEQAAGDGHPISIRGKTYAKGLGVHALSNIVYNLTTAGSCTSFNSDVGIDDEVNGAGSVVFQVLLDGVKAFDSGVVTGTSAVKTATVNVTGKSQLTLVVNDDGDGLTADHSDWAGAQLTCQ